MIPQNATWIEKLAEFIKEVHTDHKHIKLVGMQFGSQIIAYALGGEIQMNPTQPESRPEYIGKEVIAMKPEFFK